MPAFNPSRRSAAALLLLTPALAASPALAAAPAGRKAAPPKAKQPTGPQARVAFTASEQRLASVPGFPGARFFADAEGDFLRATATAKGPWIALSAGGEDGAFGAGVLAGMSAAGTRPDFALVSGVSTGALMAPYVFLGSQYDEALRASYTSIDASGIFELIETPESILDTWPLKKTIEKAVTPAMLAAVAAEHAKGRRLIVVTTNMDAGRPVAWDMGAIAARGGDKALALFRDVLLASSSIPGFFPPVHIKVEANGKTFTEMHADGATRAPFFVAPDGVLAGPSAASLAATDIYVLVNNKLATDFQVTERSMTAVLGRAISIALKLGLRGEIMRTDAALARAGRGLHLAIVPPAFKQEARGPFDPVYMQALFDFGQEHGRRGAGFGRDVHAALAGAAVSGG